MLIYNYFPNWLLRGQVLRVYFYEDGGARNLVMTMGANDVNMVMRL